MKKKIISMLLAGTMVLSMTACGGQADTAQTGSDAGADTSAGADAGTESQTADAGEAEQAGSIELVVTTTFAGEDTNAQNYKDAVKAWEAETGNTIVDTSASADETFKARVATDFETGSEPDVLFFFNGADSNSFIEAGKVVPIDEIRAEYPEYAANMNDIKELYELGYFPENTLSATDDETFAMFTDGKAAFLIGGISSGYFITRKTWDDPAKRAAAVSFVEFMTSDEMVPKFAQHGASALKDAPEVDSSEFNSLQIKSMEMMSGATSLTGAVQDAFAGDCRVSTFDGMPEIVTGRVAAEDAVAEGLETYHNQ